MRSIVILPVVFFLSACTTMRPTDPYLPLGMPSQTSSVGVVGLSPPKAPEGPMGLREAIEIALANNPEVAATGWDAAAAEARKDQAFSERLPGLGLVGNYSHHLDEQRLVPVRRPGDPAILSRDIFSGDIVLSLPLFTDGRLINQVRAAELIQEAAGHRLARSREELIFNVSSVFYNILAQRHVIESLQFSLRTLEQHVKRIDALIAAQKAARVDRMRTEVRLADIQQQLVRENNLRAIQGRILANLLGLENHDEIFLEGELKLREAVRVPQFEEALAVARKERDDYLAIRAALEAQARNVDSARAGHWPILSLQGAYGGRWAAGPTSGTGEESEDVGRIGLGVEMPLFDGGKVEARVREERANLAAAQQRLRRLELQIRLEIETATCNVSSSQERLEAIQKSLQQARESLRIEQLKYDLGKGAIVDVLDAQAALLETETTYYRVLAELQTALAQLQLAMGEE